MTVAGRLGNVPCNFISGGGLLDGGVGNGSPRQQFVPGWWSDFLD
jgi:hypothetical protein